MQWHLLLVDLVRPAGSASNSTAVEGAAAAMHHVITLLCLHWWTYQERLSKAYQTRAEWNRALQFLKDQGGQRLELERNLFRIY